MQFTLIRAVRPDILTKRFSLAPDGSLIKETTAHLTEGRASTETVPDMTAFAKVVDALRPNQALAYGSLPDGIDMARVVTRKAFEALADDARVGVVTRTKDHFSYHEGPAILMFDFDRGPDGALMPIAEGVALIRNTLVEARDVTLVTTLSASSCIVVVATGEDLTGLSGYRIYIPVDDASQIPRVAGVLNTRLLAAGHGYAAISKSGAIRIKSPIDMAVYTAPHIDFASGAACGPGLEQRRGAPQVIPGSAPWLVTASVILSDEDAAAAEAAIATLRAQAAPEAAEIARAWRAERMEALASAGVDPGTATRVLARAEKGELAGDYLLYVIDPVSREPEPVTVERILADPGRYDGRDTLDPFEPDYDGGRPTAKLFLDNPKRPRLHSMAHGGATYVLLPTSAAVSPDCDEIVIREGRTAHAVDDTIAALATTGAHYRKGRALVEVMSGTAQVLTPDLCAYRLGRLMTFRREVRVNGEIQVQGSDATPALIRQLLAHPALPLPELTACVDHPVPRPDGTLITLAGHDPATGLYVTRGIETFSTYVDAPDAAQIAEAVRVCLAPFSAYDLKAGGWTAILAAVLTAVTRPALATAPIVLVREADLGAGKSLLTEALGVIAQGDVPSPQVMPEGRAELRKRLLSLLLSETATILLDNADGLLRSDVLSAFATAATWSDRELGRSSMRSDLPNRSLLLINGRNAKGADGLSRRALPIEIAAGDRDRIGKTFGFCPVGRAVEKRDSIIGAALTLIGAVPAAFAPAGSVASFRDWDRVVRRTVAWIATKDPRFGDPRDLVMAELANDADQDGRRGLLEYLLMQVERGMPQEFTAADVVSNADLWGSRAELTEHLASISASTPTMSTKSVGSILALIRDVDVHGLSLRGYSRRGRTVWSVVNTNAVSDTPPLHLAS